mmetsp:Transcript_22106/g.34717  ORF Transcript_22106/g.34717 Transcript_22106/m.34717 type:complete len:281 (+) Transcript_22106:101-943(+)
MNSAVQKPSTLPVASEQPPEKKAKTDMSHLLQTVGGDLVKADVATEFVDLLSDQQMNMILAKIIDRKQRESNDKDVVSYKNVKNNKMMRYLKIPYCKVESAEAFASNSRWVDRAVEISCTTGDKAKDKKSNQHASAKRMTKKLMRKYPEAAKDAVKEVKKMPQENKMSGLKIASMFKAAQITSIQKRRYLLRHLRHHFGSHAFDAGHYVQKIWDGHSDPHPEMAAWIAKVDEDSCRGPRKSEEEKAIEEERKLERKRQRADGMLHSDIDTAAQYPDGNMR